MFFLVALAIWTLMHVYVLSRVRSIPAVARRVPRWAMIVIGIVLGSTYIAARVVEAVRFGAAAVVLEWIGAEWMGVLTIALGCFLIADLLTLFGFAFRDRVPVARATAAVVTVVLSVIATVNAARPPVVRDYEVRVRGLAPERDGTVVVAISDLHLGSLTSEAWLTARIAQVESLRPDLVLIAGDLAEGDGPAESEIPAVLRRLRAPLGVIAVPGNHERHHGGADAALANAGIRVLRDSSVAIAPGLYVAGVDTVGHEHVPDRGIVAKALKRVPADSASILLSHYPEQVGTAARFGADLMIAGHTHAGQIWPFNYFVRLAYRYLGGRYEVDGMPLIVCRGTGMWGPRMRLFYPNEILRIVLRRG